MDDGAGKRGRSRWTALKGRRKPAAVLGFAAAAGLAMCVHSSSPKTPPSDSLAPYAALVAELDLRRRVNVLHPNPQSIFDGLHVGHVNVGAGNLTFRRRDIVARANGPVVFARVYDSRIEANADLGPGWRLSLAEELRLEGDQAIYTDRSGAQHRFRKDGDAHVADPPTPRHAGTTLTVAERPSVETYDRLEQRPADAYAYSVLGNRYLSVTGDFDDDGRSDEAFFVRVNDKGAGMLSLIVSFGAPTKHDRIVYTRDETDAAIRNSGLKVARAGEYTGACAKGFGGPCGEGEDVLVLPHDGIVYFWFESASRLYYLPEDAPDGDFKVFHLSH